MPPALQPDARAVAVAQAIYGAARPRRLILFGSRARGDHRADSDIDILLITDEPPAEAHKEKISAAAARCAAAQYQDPVPVQLIWTTAAEYRQRRRTVNHLVARARDDGVIMPEYPADYDDPEDYDYSYEWMITAERIQYAEQNLDTFLLLVEGGRSDRMIGKNAQEAMEHALKGVISAAGARYERTHNLHRLLRQVQAAAPELNFAPRSDFRALMQYCGSDDYYPPKDPMTNSPTYRADVLADLTILLERAKRDLPPA